MQPTIDSNFGSSARAAPTGYIRPPNYTDAAPNSYIWLNIYDHKRILIRA